MRLLLYLPACFGMAAACKQPKPERVIFDYGHVKNQVYYNSYFGFKLPLIAGWQVTADAKLEELREEGRRLSPDHPPGGKNRYSPGEINIAHLLEVKNTTAGKNTPFLLAIAEKKSRIGTFTNPDEAAAGIQEYIRGQFPGCRFPWAIHDMKLDGRNASELVAVCDDDGKAITNTFYFVVEKDFLLIFLLVFDNDADEEMLKDCLNGIRFTEK